MNTENTATITSAALVTTPAVVFIPCAIASRRCPLRATRLADPAQDEHVVVHREAEQDHEQEQRDDRCRRRRSNSNPRNPLPTPCWNTSTSTPYAAATESRLSRIAFTATDERPEGDEHQREREQRGRTRTTPGSMLDFNSLGLVEPAAGGDARDARLGVGESARPLFAPSRCAGGRETPSRPASVPFPSIGTRRCSQRSPSLVDLDGDRLVHADRSQARAARACGSPRALQARSRPDALTTTFAGSAEPGKAGSHLVVGLHDPEGLGERVRAGHDPCWS